MVIKSKNMPNKHNYILAVHCGHNASSALMMDGEIIIAVQEERFCGKKNYTGYPRRAIDYCLNKGNVKGSDLAHVAYTTINFPSIPIKSKHFTQFSIRDYLDYYGERYYGRKLKGEDCLDYLRWLRDSEKFNIDEQYFDFSYLNDQVLSDSKLDAELFRQERKRTLATHLNISPDKIEFVDHHTCHAYYGYFGSPFRKEDCIVVTLDSWGDGRNQTVWKASNDELTMIVESDQSDIGRLYKMATLILGMRPDEHEYKVMGLAPYAKAFNVDRAMEVIKDILMVDGMKIVHNNRPADLYTYLRDEWAEYRFDSIAGAIQKYTEKLAKELIENIYMETGIKCFVISGGISMNVKMNKAISELDCVSSLFVCGSGSDESTSIGGCYYLNRKNKNNKYLKNLFLGYDINNEIDKIDWEPICRDYIVRHGVTYSAVASLIANGNIIAKIDGRAEFGARALGNRSILADPSKRDIVMKINEAIKNRDFWMPFALSILEDCADKYIYNPKKLKAPFMSLAFNTLPDLYYNIYAGIHPYDKTVRPQYVSKEHTPEFYNFIEEFYKLTGIPALLNTSFNLHGEPIVNDISDALRTFGSSGLDHLYINSNTLVSKRAEK